MSNLVHSFLSSLRATIGSILILLLSSVIFIGLIRLPQVFGEVSHLLMSVILLDFEF